MDDDGNSLRVSAFTCYYDTWNLLSQDVPVPDLRGERYATARNFWHTHRIHLAASEHGRNFFYIRTITLGAKRRDAQIRNRTLSAKRFDTQIRN
jgi:hypothetical protein